MDSDGITISKVTTGTHLIKDIQVAVSHGELKFIPMSQVNASSDLHRDLGARILFQLGSVITTHVRPEVKAPEPLNPVAPPQPMTDPVVSRQVSELAIKVGELDAKLDRVLTLLTSMPRSSLGEPKIHVPQLLEADDVVPIQSPMFIPDIVQRDVVGTVTTTSGVSDGSSVSGAASKLRELRKKI